MLYCCCYYCWVWVSSAFSSNQPPTFHFAYMYVLLHTWNILINQPCWQFEYLWCKCNKNKGCCLFSSHCHFLHTNYMLHMKYAKHWNTHKHTHSCTHTHSRAQQSLIYFFIVSTFDRPIFAHRCCFCCSFLFSPLCLLWICISEGSLTKSSLSVQYSSLSYVSTCVRIFVCVCVRTQQFIRLRIRTRTTTRATMCHQTIQLN